MRLQAVCLLQLAQTDPTKTSSELSANSSLTSAASNTAENSGYTQAQINELVNNPLGELWSLCVQNDTSW